MRKGKGKNMSDFKELVELCKGHRVYVQTHNFPDPDAIASAYGISKLLALYDIESKLCYDGRIDKLSASKLLNTFQMQIYPYAELLKEMEEDDYIICVDTQKHGGNVTDFVGEEVACIDHHPTFVPMEYKYQDIRITGACATLVAEYFAKLGHCPDEDTATALLYGIKMDTLQFSRGVTDLDIEMFRFLFPSCNKEKLVKLERNNMEFADLRAYGAAIESIELYDKTGFSCIPFSCPDALIAILADFILALVEVDVAVVYSYREDGIKLSVRSEDPNVHAGNLLNQMLADLGNGGGHAAMAGGFIRKDKVEKLGNYPGDAIRNLFLKTMGRL